jgi:acetylornithine aminotransferase
VSPETLLEPTLVDPTLNLNPNQPFDPDSFNSYVMNTYGRFPIAIAERVRLSSLGYFRKQYLDFVAGNCHLYPRSTLHPALIAAVSQQIQKLHHVSNLYYIPEQGELAKWIVDYSCADKVFFCNSGAEANEAAIKLVRKYAHTVLNFLEQPVILTAHASFHGRTLATITATGQPKYQKDFEPLMPGFAYIPYNDIEAVENAIADLDEGNRRVAAIMLEPLQGEGGVRPEISNISNVYGKFATKITFCLSLMKYRWESEELVNSGVMRI